MEQYVTYKISQEKYKHLNPVKDDLDFILSGGEQGVKNYNLLYQKRTETRLIETTHEKLRHSKSYEYLNKTGAISAIRNATTQIKEFLRVHNKEDMYDRFWIPKRSGGKRWIDAPNNELAAIQEYQRFILEHVLRLLPHNNAHAYTKERSIATNATFHRDSNHFARLDFSKFFPSITSEMLKEVLPKIGLFRFGVLPEMKEINEYIDALVDLATLRNSLPQGTKISPLLSNLIMIPFDYHLVEILKQEEQTILVTRYADDIVMSSFYAFADRKEDAKERLEELVMKAVDAAFSERYITLKSEKTSISTKYGKNRITGVKINANNEISIGYKEKRKLKQDLARIIIAKLNGNMNSSEKSAIVGYYNFLHAIEPEYAKYILGTLERKFNLSQPVIQFLNG